MAKVTKALAKKIEEFGKLIHDATAVVGDQHIAAADGHTVSAEMKTRGLLEQFIEEKVKSSAGAAELEQDIIEAIRNQLSSGNLSLHQLSSLLQKVSEKTQNDLALIFGIKLQRSGDGPPHVPGGLVANINVGNQVVAQGPGGQQALSVGGGNAAASMKVMKSLAAIFTSVVDEVRASEAKPVKVALEQDDGKD